MNKPESLYIHIPFCSSICDYCDFTKLQFFSFLADSYIESLIKEIEYYQINRYLLQAVGIESESQLNEFIAKINSIC